MNFTCKRKELCDAIISVSHAVPQKSTIQALEGIKVKVTPNNIELTGYNLEMGITTSISAQTDDTSEFVVNSRLFSEFVKKLEGENVNVEMGENNIIRISSADSECSFPYISAEEYPDLPTMDSIRKLSISQSILRSMINMTDYAVSQNESKPIFTGELFDIENGIFNLVALDGFRLAIRTENIENNEKYNFVVPKKALQEVADLLYDDNEKICNISVNDRHIIFEVNNFYVISRLLEGAFHNYKMSIPDSYKTEVLVNKKDLAICLERCSLIIDEKNKAPVSCDISNGTLKITCKTGIGRINDVILADISGETVTIGFNSRLVFEALKAAEGDKVRIRLNGPKKVIEILPPMNEDFIFLIMPIQLKK